MAKKKKKKKLIRSRGEKSRTMRMNVGIAVKTANPYPEASPENMVVLKKMIQSS